MSQASKIQAAYESVTETPQTFTELCDKFDVSQNTLRQVKRFNKTAKKIVIKKDKTTKSVLIYTEE